MQIPLAGSIAARVMRVTPVSIHGDLYFDVLIEPDGAPPAPEGHVNAMTVRVPMHAAPGGEAPTVGRRVTIQFLMQQVTGVKYEGQ